MLPWIVMYCIAFAACCGIMMEEDVFVKSTRGGRIVEMVILFCLWWLYGCGLFLITVCESFAEWWSRRVVE